MRIWSGNRDRWISRSDATRLPHSRNCGMVPAGRRRSADGQAPQAHWDRAHGLGRSAPHPRMFCLKVPRGRGKYPKIGTQISHPETSGRSAARSGPAGFSGASASWKTRGISGSRRLKFGTPRARRLMGGGGSLGRTRRRRPFLLSSEKYREFPRI